nr:hypothetical protein [Planococcus glaciei]
MKKDKQDHEGEELIPEVEPRRDMPDKRNLIQCPTGIWSTKKIQTKNTGTIHLQTNEASRLRLVF